MFGLEELIVSLTVVSASIVDTSVVLFVLLFVGTAYRTPEYLTPFISILMTILSFSKLLLTNSSLASLLGGSTEVSSSEHLFLLLFGEDGSSSLLTATLPCEDGELWPRLEPELDEDL